MSSNESEATPAQPRTGTRVAHVLHVAPFDRVAFAAALSSTAARLEPMALGALVVVPDRAAAAVAAAVLSSLVDPSVGDAIRVLAVGTPTRAARLVGSEQPSAVVATPSDAVAMVRSAALVPAEIPQLVLLGLDHLLADGASAEALTALLTDEPGAAGRTALVSERTEPVDGFIERYLFKAREVGVPSATPLEEGVEAMACSDAQLADAVVAVLDEIDPPGAVIVGSTGARLAIARAALTAAGYRVDSGSVRIETIGEDSDATTPAALQLVLEVPTSPERLRALLATEGARTIVLAAPSELPRLARYAGGAMRRFAPAARKAGVRTHVDGVRHALQRELETAPSAAEYALVEPLLGRHDEGAVAAVAVRLLERAWAEASAARAELASARFAPRVSAPRESDAPAFTRPERPAREGGFSRDRAPRGDRPSRGPREFGDRPRGERSFGDRPARGRDDGDRPSRGPRSFGDRPRGERSFGDRPRSFGDRPRGERSFGGERGGGERPRGERSFGGERPRGERSFGDRPRGERPFGDRPFRERPPREDRPAGPGSRGPRAGGEREWSARPPRERTEQRTEWADRGDRLARSKRPVRPRGGTDGE
ncbi:MAG: hypothetical protein MUF00_04490 [Gemmatimonadaceae bacterium]|jgi:hypothetical protein|nr:hypothetical protein [Gemmatimonadaceae bacterium]